MLASSSGYVGRRLGHSMEWVVIIYLVRPFSGTDPQDEHGWSRNSANSSASRVMRVSECSEREAFVRRHSRVLTLVSCSSSQNQSCQPITSIFTFQLSTVDEHGLGRPGRQIGKATSHALTSSSAGRQSVGGPGYAGTI